MSAEVEGRRAARILVAGTFDAGYSRNRVILSLLERGGFDVRMLNLDLWGDERHTILGSRKARLIAKALRSYGRLVFRLARAPRPDALVVLYPGHLDMLFVSAVARARRVPLIYDPFISLYETVVDDRQLKDPGSITARVLRTLDRFGCRRADLVLADTPQDAAFFAERSGVDSRRMRTLWVGAQEDVFRPVPAKPEADLVFFHGTFIRLQGIDVIVRAAKLLEPNGVRMRILGDGQERPAIERLISDLGGVGNLELVPPVRLADLPDEISRAALCLGVFGTTAKAGRVIPNKVFEYLAVGRPVLTADTPAMRTAFADDEVALVAAGDHEALARRIHLLLSDPDGLSRLADKGHERFRRDYGAAALTRLLTNYVDELLSP